MTPHAYFRVRLLPRLTAEAVYAGLPLRWSGDRGSCACPLHDGDNPNSFTVWREGLNWHCRTHCAEVHGTDRGNALDFVRLLRGVSEREAAAFLSRLAVGQPARPVARRPPSHTRQAALPPGEVADVWRRALPVTSDPEAAKWLERYAIEPAAVARLDLARVLPRGAAVPAWASHWFWEQRVRGFGTAPAWRLVLPAYDAAGRLASLRARTTVHPLPRGRDGDAPKELAPRGGGTTGLLLADAWGRRLLAGERAAAARVRRCGLLIAEGTKDLLTLATERGAPPTWAVYSDSWTKEHAARIPDGTTVTIATHADPKGHEYASTIGRAFRDRDVDLRRIDWSE